MASSLRFLVIAVMLLTATALGIIGVQIVHPARAPHHAVASRPLSYLVASRALPVGTLANDHDFTARTAPAASVPAGAITDSPAARARLRGVLVRVRLAPGQPVTMADILTPDDHGFIARILPPGRCAVSIAVDPATGVSGLVWPGDHVDVILTQSMDNQPVAQRVLSETILSNVRVLAIDQRIATGQPATATTHPPRTVTLEVTPRQADKLTVATQLGRLTLAIRGMVAHAPPKGATIDSVYSADVSPALARRDKPVGQTVQVIEGDKRTQVIFQ